MKKIAIPTRDGRIDDHFGHCDHYTIYSIENNEVVAEENMASPEGCGCKSGVAAELQQMGVEIMLAGNMGEGAKNKLEGCNIQVIRGCHGEIREVLDAYLAGKISDSGIGCSAHNDHHSCHEHGSVDF